MADSNLSECASNLKNDEVPTTNEANVRIIQRHLCASRGKLAKPKYIYQISSPNIFIKYLHQISSSNICNATFLSDRPHILNTYNTLGQEMRTLLQRITINDYYMFHTTVRVLRDKKSKGLTFSAMIERHARYIIKYLHQISSSNIFLYLFHKVMLSSNIFITIILSIKKHTEKLSTKTFNQLLQ